MIKMEKALLVGKRVIIEGSKAVCFTAGSVAVQTLFTKGLNGVKGLTLDDILQLTKKEG